MEGSELFRHAENWLKSNPGKTLRDYRKETGYSGPALKTRQRKGNLFVFPIKVKALTLKLNGQRLKNQRLKLKQLMYERLEKRQGSVVNRHYINKHIKDALVLLSIMLG